MYPSNSHFASNNNNNDNLISPPYALDHTLPNKPSIYEINTHSVQGDPYLPPLYHNILSPFYQHENDEVLFQHIYDLYLQQQPQIAEVNAPNPIRTEMDEPSENIEQIIGECSGKKNEYAVKEIPKTRTSKKDRHSKIETAQGPRDRRMRLSLQVARDFFDLQDTLGYNKASKTVEWLLSKSKAAIKDLTSCSTNTPTSTSECEVVSQEKGKHLVSPTKEAKNMRGSTRKPSFNPLTKESREKARARARERTREKKKGDVSKIGFETAMSHQMNPLGSWCQDENNSSQLQVLDDVEELNSSMIFNYHMPNTGTSQEHQFADLDLYEKPWDAYNNTNLR